MTEFMLVVVVQSKLCPTLCNPWTAACQTSLSFIISWSLHNSCPLSWWCHPTISSSVTPLSFCPPIFPSIFSSELALHIRWPKYWSFSFSISPSNEYSGLISFRIDSFNLLAVQGPLKSLFQHHSLKASILRHPSFFMDQLSHPYVTTGKVSFGYTDICQQSNVSAF